MSSSDFVKVVFRLYHLPDYALTTLRYKNGDRNGVYVALLGSIDELGEWELGHQLTAKPSPSEPNVWEVTVQLPVCSTFEVSWLVADGDKKILFWDPSDDHGVRLSYHDAVVQVSWNRDPTYFISRTCTLILNTHYYCTEGEVLAAVGSTPCLGSWNPQQSVLARDYPRDSGNWQVLTQVAMHCEYEWKWVVVDAHTREVKRWEEGDNRYLTTNCERLSIRASWNSPSCIQSHSAKIYDMTIDMDKVAKFYDTVENCESLVSREMNHVTATWNKRRETGEKTFVITETERAAAMELKGKSEQKLRSQKSFLRKIARVVCPLCHFLLDCYRWVE